MENKQQSEVCPPVFKEKEYDLWKKKMMPFLTTTNSNMVDIINNDIPTLHDNKGKILLEILGTKGKDIKLN